MFNEPDFEPPFVEALASNGWRYFPAGALPRDYGDVLVEPMVKAALIRLNPCIAEDPTRADEVLFKLRALIMTANANNLVTQNEAFKKLVFEQNSFPFGENGKMDASFIMHMDKNATFEVKMDVKDVDTDVLNSFVRPLVGITSQCHINQLDAHYMGDRNIAKGEFCMQYHGLEVLVHKTDKIPYEIVTRYADTFTELANTLVPKSNPTAVDPAPRKYAVEWKRDEWKPYPLFVFGPCIDGIKMTMLPGLYVHKQIK